MSIQIIYPWTLGQSQQTIVQIPQLIIFFNFRHEARQIYTYIGDVCVSVNPYTALDIYGMDYVNQYKGNGWTINDT